MLESDEELEERLQSFAAKQESAEATLQRLLQREQVAKKQMDHARALLTKATGERGQLTAKIEQLVSHWCPHRHMLTGPSPVAVCSWAVPRVCVCACRWAWWPSGMTRWWTFATSISSPSPGHSSVSPRFDSDKY